MADASFFPSYVTLMAQIAYKYRKYPGVDARTFKLIKAILSPLSPEFYDSLIQNMHNTFCR